MQLRDDKFLDAKQSLCPECRVPWTKGLEKCKQCGRTWIDLEHVPSKRAARPRFQFSLSSLLQLMTVASIQLTLFVLSPLVGTLALFIHLPGLWRTIEAVRVDRKTHQQTPWGVVFVIYVYSLGLFALTYAGVFGLAWASIKGAGECLDVLERVLGYVPEWCVFLLGMSMLSFIFALVVLAYVLLFLTWPREKCSVACAEPVNPGN